jgi:hypothetical protein
MTKEEYRNLLQSDYWKGYSYSIIKERNFTCEDCGRVFLNERNKLQVHHLVYRDIMPWSYKPEELVVLCRECHERRHGITPVEKNVLEDTDMRNKGISRLFLYFSAIKNFILHRVKWKTMVKMFFCVLTILVFYLIAKTINDNNAIRNRYSSENRKENVKSVRKVKKNKKKTKKKAKVEKDVETDDFVPVDEDVYSLEETGNVIEKSDEQILNE